MDREGTRHNCCSLRNSHHCGEVETTLLDLHGLLLSLVLIVLILSTSLILQPGVRTGIHKMPGFLTIVATSFIVVAGRWGCIRLSILLLKIWGTEIPLLLILGSSHNPMPRMLVPLRILWSLLNYAELALRHVVRVERSLPFLCILHPLHCILLGYGQVHYLMIDVRLGGVQFFIELGIKTLRKRSIFFASVST
jgi:hypothetical protein